MKAVRMASYADADRTVFGSAGQGTRNFRPGRRIQSRTMPASNIGIYLHRPPDRLGPILRNAGKSCAAGHAFSEASLASFHSRHFSRSACMRPASFPFSTERNPWGIPPYPPFFPPCPRTMFPAAYLFRLDIIPARNRINGKLRHPVFHGLGENAFRFRLFFHRNIFLLPAGLFLTFAPFQLLPSPFSRSSRSACS